MPAFLKSILINFVFGFVLQELQKAEGQIDWTALKAKIDAHILSWPFPKFVDQEFDLIADNCLGVCKLLLDGPLQKQLLEDLKAGNFAKALSDLTAAIAGSVLPTAIAPEALQQLALLAVSKPKAA